MLLPELLGPILADIHHWMQIGKYEAVYKVSRQAVVDLVLLLILVLFVLNNGLNRMPPTKVPLHVPGRGLVQATPYQDIPRLVIVRQGKRNFRLVRPTQHAKPVVAVILFLLVEVVMSCL